MAACTVRVEFSSVSRESGLLVHLDIFEKALLDVRRDHGIKETPNSKRQFWQCS
jgi:hypothetical protein